MVIPKEDQGQLLEAARFMDALHKRKPPTLEDRISQEIFKSPATNVTGALFRI